MNSTVVSNRPSRSDVRVIPGRLENLRVHMIGIGGTGMSGLAALLLRRGARVSGSDLTLSSELTRLAESGARVTTRQGPESVPDDCDLVVASAAIPGDHPELLAARRRGLPTLKYAQMLGALMAHHDGIAISGTHGKSTTTAWLAYVLRRAGCDPSFVVGATVPQLGGGSGAGDGPLFVAEACEYDRSFLNLHPRRAAILNIEEDHLDCYHDLHAIRAAFAQFADRVPPDGLVVLNAADARCRELAPGIRARVERFGDGPQSNWRVRDLSFDAGCGSFTVVHNGEVLGRAAIALAGRHNVDNALAVIALARDCGVPWDVLAPALGEFRGAHRRLELRGTVGGVHILDDYAHHPTEIRVTLEAARARYRPHRLWVVFQPHQHSRTRFLLADFARSFAQAERVVVPDIYFVRDSERERELVCAADLVRAIRDGGGHATYVPAFDDIVALLAREVSAGDAVLTMGAGNIWKVADELVRRLGGHLPD